MITTISNHQSNSNLQQLIQPSSPPAITPNTTTTNTTTTTTTEPALSSSSSTSASTSPSTASSAYSLFSSHQPQHQQHPGLKSQPTTPTSSIKTTPQSITPTPTNTNTTTSSATAPIFTFAQQHPFSSTSSSETSSSSSSSSSSSTTELKPNLSITLNERSAALPFPTFQPIPTQPNTVFLNHFNPQSIHSNQHHPIILPLRSLPHHQHHHSHQSTHSFGLNHNPPKMMNHPPLQSQQNPFGFTPCSPSIFLPPNTQQQQQHQPTPFIRHPHSHVHPPPHIDQLDYRPTQTHHHTNWHPIPLNTNLPEPYQPAFYDPFQIKHRRRTTPAQLNVLEAQFESNCKPDVVLRKSLAEQLDMTPREVQVWFQNRRAKTKKLEKRAEQQDAKASSEQGTGETANGSTVEQAEEQTSGSTRASLSPQSSVFFSPTHTSNSITKTEGSEDFRHQPSGQTPEYTPTSLGSGFFSPTQLHEGLDLNTGLVRPKFVSPDYGQTKEDVRSHSGPPNDSIYRPVSLYNLPPSFVFGTAPIVPSSIGDEKDNLGNGYDYSRPRASITSSIATSDSHHALLTPTMTDFSLDQGEEQLPIGFDPRRRASCPAEFIQSFGHFGFATPQPPLPPPTTSTNVPTILAEDENVDDHSIQRRHSVASIVNYGPNTNTSTQNHLNSFGRRSSTSSVLNPIEEHSVLLGSPSDRSNRRPQLERRARSQANMKHASGYQNKINHFNNNGINGNGLIGINNKRSTTSSLEAMFDLNE